MIFITSLNVPVTLNVALNNWVGKIENIIIKKILLKS